MARAMVTELSSGTRLPARTSELGLNGCYIDTLELFPVGTLVQLRILKDNGVFETSGKVLYCHPGIGMGLVLVGSTPDQRGVLGGWVTKLGARCMPTSLVLKTDKIVLEFNPQLTTIRTDTDSMIN